MGADFVPADFHPQLVGYTGQGAFRFWCQKVLPIVYDDSLSYYELLNKVVVYLNNVISDFGSMADNLDEVVETFNQLQDWVNQYLDLDAAVAKQLDKMAENGELERVFGDLIRAEIDQWLDLHPEATTTVLDGSIDKQKLTERMQKALFFAMNVEYLGVTENDSPETALAKINDIISSGEYNALIIPPSIDYGYDYHTSTFPDITLSPERLTIFDLSRDRSHGEDTDAYEADQVRIWMRTPTEQGGQTDGNGFMICGNYHPYLRIINTNDAEHRASVAFGGNTINWLIGQGIYSNDVDFKIVRNTSNGLTTAFGISKETGNIGIGMNSTAQKVIVAGSVRIVPDQVYYLLVSDSAGSSGTYTLNKSADSTGEKTFFNGSQILWSKYDTSSIEHIHTLKDGNDSSFTSFGFSLTYGFFITNIGKTTRLFHLKDSGVFTLGVSGGSFTTSGRPTVTETGVMIFDNTLKKPIWWDGSKWIDAVGNEV